MLILLNSGCIGGQNNAENKFAEVFKVRASTCPRFKYMDSKISNDTLKAAFKTPIEYLNQTTLKQDFWYLTQDVDLTVNKSINFLELHFHYPNRKNETHFNVTYSKNEFLNIQNSNVEIIEKVNQLYLSDTKNKENDFVEHLNIEYSIAIQDVIKEKFELFGRDIFEFTKEEIKNCDLQNPTHNKIKDAMLNNVKANQEYSIEVKNQLVNFINNICK